MGLKDLAPWIAIAITLALSILVPLFTQIANNRHQRKMMLEKIKHEEAQKKRIVYEDFLLKVGASILTCSDENLSQAGASINQMYIYCPQEWWEDLDNLSNLLQHYEWKNASKIMNKLSREIAKELH